MPEYDNTNRGALFTQNKRTKETQPHYKGVLNVEGKDYEIVGWVRKAKSPPHDVFISLSVRPQNAN